MKLVSYKKNFCSAALLLFARIACKTLDLLIVTLANTVIPNEYCTLDHLGKLNSRKIPYFLYRLQNYIQWCQKKQKTSKNTNFAVICFIKNQQKCMKVYQSVAKIWFNRSKFYIHTTFESN